jgi:RHS repeat-associated protein
VTHILFSFRFSKPVWNGEDPNIPDEIVPPNEGGISPFFSYQYYDNYDFITDPNLQFDTASAFHEKSGRIRGRETGSKVKYIDGGIEKWLTSVVYYDKYGRAVQSISKNSVGGYDIVNNRYNFAGELLESKQKHTDYLKQTKYLVYLYRYDETGRLLNLSLSQNENGSNAVMIDSLTYHETGQVKEKRMHSENGTGFLQTVDYTYNIRGALTFMNNPDTLNGDLFAMRLFYDKKPISNNNPYNDGKINAMEWRSKNLAEKQTYEYTYDDANRLTGATFTPSGRYDMTFAYDKNGNITNLTRNGQIITNALKDGVKTEIISYGTIDNLSYGYTGNQLLTVSDLIGSITTQLNNDFRDNGINLRTEYEYDANGNMTKDLNKGISLVKYNHLNQPVEVRTGTNKTLYTYTSTGLKLACEEWVYGLLNKKTEYSGAFVYENAQLSYINIPDGRYVVSTGKYEYNLTDHLGNVHVTFTKSATGTAELISEDHYYPFGLQMSGQHFENTTFLNKYLYNGKEKQTQTGYFDYGFRQLDPQLCRWHVADAMAESYLSISPYAYVENNPISFMDYMGLTKMSMEDAIAYLFSDKCEFGGTWTNSGGGGGDVKEHTAADVRNMNHTRDDYFTRNGEYLGYSAVGSSSIRILNTTNSAIPDGFYINETMKTIDPFIGLLNSWSLSEARQLGEVDDNSLMKIFNYYKEMLGINLKLIKSSKSHIMQFAFYENYKGIKGNFFIIGIEVNIKIFDATELYDNFNNIISDLIHEKKHFADFKKNPEDFVRKSKMGGEYNEYLETAPFLAQMNDPSFKYVSHDFLQYQAKYMNGCGILVWTWQIYDKPDLMYSFWAYMKDRTYRFHYNFIITN